VTHAEASKRLPAAAFGHIGAPSHVNELHDTDQALDTELTSVLELSPRRKLIFAIVSVALFMASVDQTIVATALPLVQSELHTHINWSIWTITTYSLGQVLAMPVAGKLSDQFGRKRIFISAAVLFTTASLCCGLATSIYMLIILRGVQAIGGGAFMPSATGIVADHFGQDRDRAVAMFTSIFPIGGIVGPILGGVIATYWSWRGIFLVNVPVGILLIVLCLKFLPSSGRRTRAPVDVAGVALLGVMILGVMFGFTLLGTSSIGVASWEFFVPELVGVAAAYAFLRHMRRHATPFIPVRLLYGRGFGIMNLINMVYGSAALGLASLVPLYAEERFGLPTLDASTLLTARALGMIAIAGMASMALRRTGTRWPMAIGFSILAAGMLMLALPPAFFHPYVALAIAAGITGLGMGMAVPASNNATLQLAPDQIAAIAGLRGMFRQSGGILALSVTTALIAKSTQPAQLESHIFVVFSIFLLLLVPLNLLVPDHRGSW
jgi:EmrB/QacA subfamily drug resistance transporter